MFGVLFATIVSFLIPAERGFFHSTGIYLVRVEAVKVPDHPKLLGDNTLRVTEVLIGPESLGQTVSTYKFFTPSGERDFLGGSQYSGKYPHFAYPMPKGQSRYWWAAPDAGGWKTADFRKVSVVVPTSVSEMLLKADLKPGSKEATLQKDLADTLVRLESRRSRIEQLTELRQMQNSKNEFVIIVADRMLKNLMTPPKTNPKPK